MGMGASTLPSKSIIIWKPVVSGYNLLYRLSERRNEEISFNQVTIAFGQLLREKSLLYVWRCTALSKEMDYTAEIKYRVY